ncbi:hypothetical protein MRX96_029311 [Rhipicephalus microplus]
MASRRQQSAKELTHVFGQFFLFYFIPRAPRFKRTLRVHFAASEAARPEGGRVGVLWGGYEFLGCVLQGRASVHRSRTARSFRARLCFSGFRGLEIASDNSDPCCASTLVALIDSKAAIAGTGRAGTSSHGSPSSAAGMKTALLVCAVFYTAYGGSELPPVCPLECRCRDNFTVVACSHRQLRRFPAPLPHSAQELDVSFNSIEHVPTLVVARLTKATFCHNRVRTIPRGTFAHATVLRTLDFSHNCLVSLAADDLDGLGMLTDLDLSCNELRKLRTIRFPQGSESENVEAIGKPAEICRQLLVQEHGRPRNAWNCGR